MHKYVDCWRLVKHKFIAWESRNAKMYPFCHLNNQTQLLLLSSHHITYQQWTKILKQHPNKTTHSEAHQIRLLPLLLDLEIIIQFQVASLVIIQELPPSNKWWNKHLVQPWNSRTAKNVSLSSVSLSGLTKRLKCDAIYALYNSWSMVKLPEFLLNTIL